MLTKENVEMLTGMFNKFNQNLKLELESLEKRNTSEMTILDNCGKLAGESKSKYIIYLNNNLNFYRKY
jgi:hypothetical protein